MAAYAEIIQQWNDLVHKLISETNPSQEDVSNQIWSSLRTLFTRTISAELLESYLSQALSSDLLLLHTFALGVLAPPFIGFNDSETDNTGSIRQLALLNSLIRHVLLVFLQRGSASVVPKHLIEVPSEAPLALVIDAVVNAIALVRMVYADARLTPTGPDVALNSASAAVQDLPSNAAQLLVQVLDSLGQAEAVSSAEAARILSYLNEIAHLRLGSAIVGQLSNWTNHLSYIALNAQQTPADGGIGGPGLHPLLSEPSEPSSLANQDPRVTTSKSLLLPEGTEIACSIAVQKLLSEVPGGVLYPDYAVSV